MTSLSAVESTLTQSTNGPTHETGLDILRAGLHEPDFGVEIPELDLNFETIRIDGTRRLAALVGTTALIAGVGASTSVSEAVVSPQYGTTGTCPNPYVDYPFYKKDFPSRPAPAGSDLVVVSNNQYAIPSTTVLNNYVCVGQTSKAEFGIENVGPEPAQGSTITVSTEAGVHIDAIINPDTRGSLANCKTGPNNQSLTCSLGDLAMMAGTVYVDTMYHADPLVAGSQNPKPSSITASVQSSTAENYPADNQVTHQFDIRDKATEPISSQPDDPSTLPSNPEQKKSGLLPPARVEVYGGVASSARGTKFCGKTIFFIWSQQTIKAAKIKSTYTSPPIKPRRTQRALKTLTNRGYSIPIKVCGTDKTPRAKIEVAAQNAKKTLKNYKFNWNRGKWILVKPKKSTPSK